MRSLAARVVVHAQQYADVPAVSDGAVVLTYRRLAERAATIAAELRAGPARDAQSVVAVLMPRSGAAVVAAVAVQAADGVFLPLDPRDPVERLRAMVADAHATCIVTTSDGRERAAALGVPVLVVGLDDTANQPVTDAAVELAARHEAGEEPAVLTFTSGSTGRPRGVLTTDVGLANLALSHHDRFGVRPADRIGWASDVGFDAAIWDVWSTLWSGATLVVAADDDRLDPRRFLTWLGEERIRRVFLVTSLAQEVVRIGPPPDGFDLLLLGGDKLRQLPEDSAWTVVNAYGPSEAAVVATWSEPLAGSQSAPDVGRPLPGVEVRIVDDNWNLVPTGERGEVVLSGVSLAIGYLGSPAATATRFVASPWDPGQRCFASGDEGWLDEQGRLHIVGRLDEQIKIRGVRVEPSEVEAVVRSVAGVSEALALPISVDGDAVIGLLWVGEDGSDVDVDAVLDVIRDRVLPVAVPRRVEVVPALPLTPRGKVDRDAARALLEEPKPDDAADTGPGDELDPLALFVAEAFALSVPCPLPTAHDSFFELGGNSIKAVRVVGKLRKVRPELQLVEFFTKPTVGGLAEVMRAHGATVDDVARARSEGALVPEETA